MFGNFTIGVSLLLATATAGPEAAPSNVVFSKQRAFRVPLDLTAAEREQISAIRFFVSPDQGKTWTHDGDGAPETEIYTFHADKDGEYWFSIALVDRFLKQSPADIQSAGAGLKVKVDTEPPTLMLKPIKSKSGRRGVRWELTDTHLDTNSLRLAVWENETAGWRPYEVTEQDKSLVWFEQQENVLKIQGVVKDHAGNESIIQIDLQGDRFAKQFPKTFALKDSRQAQAIRIPRAVPKSTASASEIQTVSFAAPSSDTPPAPVKAAIETPPAPPASSVASAPHALPVASAPPTFAPEPPVSDEAAFGSREPQMPDMPTKAQIPSVPEPAPFAQPPVVSRASRVSEDLPLSESNVTDVPQAMEIARAEELPAVSQSPVAVEKPVMPESLRAPGAARSPAIAKPASEPLPEGVSFCNSKVVVVNYELEKNGSPETTVVELWGTKDRGKNWARLSVDKDGASPIEASLSEEGLWGLMVVVYDRELGAPPTPKPGAEPEAYIDVDTAAPYVEVATPQIRAAQAILQWTATDPNLTSQPVRLLYSPTGESPWLPIAEAVENNGEFVWNLKRAGVPGPFFVRVEVQDRAGNIGVAETPTAVSLEAAQPRGRVMSIQSKAAPTGASSQAPFGN